MAIDRLTSIGAVSPGQPIVLTFCPQAQIYIDGSCRNNADVRNMMGWTTEEVQIMGSRTSMADFLSFRYTDPHTGTSVDAVVVPGHQMIGYGTYNGVPLAMWKETTHSWDQLTSTMTTQIMVYGPKATISNGTLTSEFGLLTQKDITSTPGYTEVCENGECLSTYYHQIDTDECLNAANRATYEDYRECVEWNAPLIAALSAGAAGTGCMFIVAGSLPETLGVSAAFTPECLGIAAGTGVAAGVGAWQYCEILREGRNYEWMETHCTQLTLDDPPLEPTTPGAGSDTGGCTTCDAYGSSSETVWVDDSYKTDEGYVITGDDVTTVKTGCTDPGEWDPEGVDSNGDGFCD